MNYKRITQRDLLHKKTRLTTNELQTNYKRSTNKIHTIYTQCTNKLHI